MKNGFLNILGALFIFFPFEACALTESTIHVEWGYTPPSSSFVSGFNLYQDGVFACQTQDPFATSMNCQVILTAPITSFTLTATFNDGTESPHSAPFTYSISDKVQQLYTSYLARAADQDGLNYWVSEILSGSLTFEQLRSNLTNEQPEYQYIFGDLDREQLVTRIYANLFMRLPDEAGLLYWTVGKGSLVNPDQLIIAFLNSASDSDQKVIKNVIRVANYYTEKLGDSTHFDHDKAAAAIEYIDGSENSVLNSIKRINYWLNSSQ
jgi:hypothetical protein